MGETNPNNAYLPPQVNRRWPVVTYTIVGITTICYLLQWFLGGVEDATIMTLLGAKWNPLIYAGEYWRLLTPVLLHGGFLHIVLNMVSLYNIGPTVEALYGRARLLVIYLMAGVSGTALSYAFSPYLSVGASGAIFGLIGALLAFGRHYPREFKRLFGSRLWTILLINLVYGFVNRGIDNFGHIGGMVGGYLAAELVAPYRDTRMSAFRVIGIAGYVLFIAFCMAMGPALFVTSV
ncbi:MAG: rhomboid family intramembrane serine protease [Christensenellales bacterium]|jgi:rhomboid protease GluP